MKNLEDLGLGGNGASYQRRDDPDLRLAFQAEVRELPG